MPSLPIVSDIALQRARPGRRSVLRRALSWCLACHGRWVQRHALTELGDHQLHDIGLTRADVFGEIRKPFWRE
jgi:uncharacterized protein YjiS (DUF1127 family)